MHLVTHSYDYSEINRTTLHTGLYAISTCIDTIFPESHGTENKNKYCHAKSQKNTQGQKLQNKPLTVTPNMPQTDCEMREIMLQMSCRV